MVMEPMHPGTLRGFILMISQDQTSQMQAEHSQSEIPPFLFVLFHELQYDKTSAGGRTETWGAALEGQCPWKVWRAHLSTALLGRLR